MGIATGQYNYRILLALISVMVLLWVPARGQISITSATYFQDFNTLVNTGSSTVLPEGWAFNETGSNANSNYAAGYGSISTGDTYSFGTGTLTDRAFGGLRSTNLVPIIGASFTNNTGSTINEITIEYTGEQWRLGAADRVDRLDFQYSLNATNLTIGAWIDVDALDFTSPITAGIVGALDGNIEANKLNITATITGLSIPGGASFWIRWNDVDAAGSDDGLGIDDFYLSANSTCNVSISGYVPSAGPAGTIVSITGANFTGVSAVYFDGILSPLFTVNSATSITATVPESANSGPITIYKSCTAASMGSFNVLKNSCTTGATDLFISEYIEGSSNNKAIEIANFTGNAINLSGYTVAGYFNGNSSPNTFITLPNVELPNNQVWVVVPSNATDALKTYANQITGIGWFNGNDAVVLKKGAADIDIFGNIGCDPGVGWESGGLQTNDVTLVRKPNIFNGITSNPPPCTFPTLSTEWDQYLIDDFSHLGNHTVTYSATPPTITNQPGSATVCVGASTPLSIIATGAVSYQWKWLNGGVWQNVTDLAGTYSGATTPSLIIIGSMGLNGIQYYCEAYSTTHCLTASNSVQLTVNPLPTTSAINHH
ncbi:MAG: hypothetical protein GZ094_04010 [Mariniphaga sp.]|nr:hypothetical protein [Mariniphaga sp.]